MKHFEASMVTQDPPVVRRRANWELNRTRAIVQAQAPDTFVAQHVAALVERESVARAGEAFVFDDEVDFWRAAQHLGLATVKLNRFVLSDWFPRTPGVYWSPLGLRTRCFVSESGPERDRELGDYYAPYSKMELVERGGIGNVRLAPKRIDGVRCWLGSATAGSQAAGGVPLAIPEAVLRGADVTWGDTVELVGEVRYLTELGLDVVGGAVHHASPVILLVHEMKGVAQRDRRDERLLITPVVLISLRDKPEQADGPFFGGYSYSFVSCTSSPAELDDAAGWMSRYAAKFGARVLTNFDETRPLLADAPLSYQRLVARSHDHTVIERLTLNGTLTACIDRIGTMSSTNNVNNVNNVTLGNGVVVHGSLTVANAIRDSFNRGESVASPDLRALLTTLASQVGEVLQRMPPEAAEKVADDLATLTKELSRAEPRRQWWQLSVEGIKEAATALGEIGAPIVGTVAALLPLLAGGTP